MTDERPDLDASFASNRCLWEAWTAIHAAGEEMPFLDWGTDFLVETEPGSGRHVLPDGPGELPLMFTLQATKPER